MYHILYRMREEDPTRYADQVLPYVMGLDFKVSRPVLCHSKVERAFELQELCPKITTDLALYEAEDFARLHGLTNVVELEAMELNIKDLTPIAQMVGMLHPSLDRNAIEDLPPDHRADQA